MPTAAAASADPSISKAPPHMAVGRTVLASTSALAVATAAERGLGFLANLLAARIGGVATFGAYSLAITTAGSVASYAGAGIGSTAARFSGEYPFESQSYRPFTLALLLVSCLSAVLAFVVLLLGAAPLARLMQNEALTGLLQWAALSAAAIILLECCRGFLIGQRRFSALMFLSTATGIGMLAAVPALSRIGAAPMIIGQSSVILVSIGACVLLARRFGFAPGPALQAPTEPVVRMARKVWTFGGVQLASLIGLNAAGWWVASLVARADSSMVQMGLFAVAAQLRNMAGLAPGLLTQGNYALMAEHAGQPAGMADRVMTYCSFVATLGAFVLAGACILVLPWVLPMVYGSAYSAAVLPSALALATAIVHMGAAPAAARLTVVSLKLTGFINAGWAVLVILLAMRLIPHNGATAATAIYLAVHLFSATLVLAGLWRRRGLPDGMLSVFVLGSAGSLGLAVLSWLRTVQPESEIQWTAVLAAFAAAISGLLVAVGRKHGWLPAQLRWQSILSSLKPEAMR